MMMPYTVKHVCRIAAAKYATADSSPPKKFMMQFMESRFENISRSPAVTASLQRVVVLAAICGGSIVIVVVVRRVEIGVVVAMTVVDGSSVTMGSGSDNSVMEKSF
jgi:hypothetical protein